MARTPELSEKVVDQLKKMITQNMKPGDQLPAEGELMSIFAVSRSAIRELERYVWQMQNPDASDSDFQKIDIQFHRRLAEATGNAILVELICSVRNVISEKQAETCKIQPIQKQVIASHNKLMDALRAHNTEQALAYMKEHLRISQVFYGFMPESSCEGDKVDNLHWRESVKSE